MSRAYRIEVQEAFEVQARGCDAIESQLKLLPLLIPDRMAGILEEELEKDGFQRGESGWVKDLSSEPGKRATLEIDPRHARATLRAEVERSGKFLATRRDTVMDDPELAQAVEKDLKNQVLADAEGEKKAQQARANQEAATWLESLLPQVREAVHGLTHRVTARALREKAEALGKVQSIDEDPQRRTLTIVLEV